MILGAHNSLSCYKPRHWWMRPFWFMAKCQQKSPAYLFKYCGVRLFDIRVVFNKDGSKYYPAHGAISFDADIDVELNRLNILARLYDAKVYVRLMNERPSGKKYFAGWCKEMVQRYPHLIFFGGNDKLSWTNWYDFGVQPDKKMVDLYSSVTGSKIDDLTPFIYAKKHNQENIQKYKDEDVYLFIDFIDYY